MDHRLSLTIVAIWLLWTVAGCAIFEESTPSFGTGEHGVLEVDAETDSDYRLEPASAVNPRDGAAYRSFEIELRAGDALSITADSDDFPPHISLYAPDGALMGSASATGDDYTNRLIRPIASDGVYVVVISAPTPGSFGVFELSVETVDPPSEDLTFPGQISGIFYGDTFGSDDTQRQHHAHTGAPKMSHRLQVDDTGFVRLTVESDEFEPRLSIVDADTGEILVEAESDQSRTAELLTELPADTYEVWVSRSGLGSDGYYQLRATGVERDRPADFTVGEVFDGVINWQKTQAPFHFRSGHELSFELDEPAVFDASIDSDAFFPVAMLTEGDDRIVTEADSDPLGQSDVRLIRPLEPGHYTLWIASYDDAFQGPYRVQTELRDPPPAESLQPDATVDGALTEGAALHPSRYTFIEYYTVELDEETRLRIDLQSDQFDAYLIIEDPSGEIIDQNDDAHMGTTDAGIERTFEPGTYRIGATTFSPDTLGAFRLTVERTIR